MPILQDFPGHEMPPHVAAQIRSYTRMQWPTLSTGQTQIWNYLPQPTPSRHFVLTEGEFLLSHAAANQRDLLHQSRTWRVAGLSTVFTYPDYRGHGFASQVVAAATTHIQRSDADLAILFAGPHLENFYHRHAWLPIPTARILFGPPKSPQRKTDNLIMMLFISEFARENRALFSEDDFYIGPATW